MTKFEASVAQKVKSVGLFRLFFDIANIQEVLIAMFCISIQASYKVQPEFFHSEALYPKKRIFYDLNLVIPLYGGQC